MPPEAINFIDCPLLLLLHSSMISLYKSNEGPSSMPSLEMSDLLTDVINDLKEKQSNSFTSYVKSIKTRKKGINAKR